MSSLMDEIIRDAMRRGDFDNLPGQGAPLPKEEMPVPEELRMAHKIMKDNEVVPDWITAGKELDAEYQKLRTKLRASATPSDSFREAVTAYNKRVLSYNLKLPPGIAHRFMFDIERERKRG